MLLHVPDKPVIVRSAQNRVLAIDHKDLDYIQIDFQARLQFGDVEVIIECPFVLTVDNVVYRLDPDERAGLHLTFDSGATIVVPQHVQYEAWQVHDDKGWLLVCTPGTTGDLAEWTNS
jgi:hypothetical protein